MTVPFIIYALPRSRTFWLSRYLSYGAYHCAHEQMGHLRGLDDARAWLSQDCTGTAETAAAPWWRLVRHFRPDIRTLVVRRAVAAVADSLTRLDMRGVCTFERDRLAARLWRIDRCLDRIERQPGVLSVRFDDLTDEDTCARVFEHCLPYRHDPAWWPAMAPLNLQCSMPALMRYYFAHQPQIDAAAAFAQKQMRQILTSGRRPGPLYQDGITIQAEPFDIAWHDAQRLVTEHALAIGDRADSILEKNTPLIAAMDRIGAVQTMTARCNGRLFGYLLTIIGPALEDRRLLSATQTTFFVSPDFRGLGMRLQRASIERLRALGVGEVNFRAGVVGSGPRMGVLYRRLGAAENGRIYTLKLKAA